MAMIEVDGTNTIAAHTLAIDDVQYVEIEPHATNSTALRALSETLSRLVHVAPRGEPSSSDLVVMAGRYFVPDGFMAKACERQGYVKRVIR